MSAADATEAATTVVGGPFFEDLGVGDVYDAAPALTLTEGLAAAHQAIVGDRLALALDATLSASVLGERATLAHPALVTDVAIGQSTLPTQRVIANLFYRGLVLHRAPRIGDTLFTTTTVVGLRENSRRPGRAPTGLAGLRVQTTDQEGRDVLDFVRCAMLPLGDPDRPTGHADDLDALGAATGPLDRAVDGWALDRFRARTGASVAHFRDVRDGQRWASGAGDVVSSAPELARLTLNVAAVHSDAGASAAGQRLVYGGHTIGIAAAQATRMLPGLVTIAAWHGCDHLAPVYEGDTLHSTLTVSGREPRAHGGGLVHLRSRVRAVRASDESDVLDWRFVGVMA